MAISRKRPYCITKLFINIWRTVQITKTRGHNLAQKKGKYPKTIKNLRPISLTNTDYKILPKALAKRTEEILPKIIHENQTGFIKGRYIGENIRLIDDIIENLTLTARV